MRNLTDDEIGLLEEQGCCAEDWLQVLVSDDFTPDSLHNVTFYGLVEIGSFLDSMEIEEGFVRRTGIRDVVLRNVTVGDNCLIEHVAGHLSNCDIGANSYIANVGIITSNAPSFGIGNEVAVLNEGGDPNVVMTDVLTAQLAFLMIQNASVYDLVKRETTARPLPQRTLIGEHVRITFTREITNVIIGDYSEIQGSSRLVNTTLVSTGESSTYVGSDVILENSIVAAGASVVDGAKVDNCFVGESTYLGKGFSATNSLFFANGHFENGEACAAFCGPFSASHHKSTLLIGGMFSFFNAGSGTNQSNHAYKMGPVHWGVLDRGSKTASGCHILWPARFGAFTMVMGKVSNHPDLRQLPFSYVIGEAGQTVVVPGVNFTTLGTWRDIHKWKKRDLRLMHQRHDLIEYAFPNPHIICQVQAGKALLEQIEREQGVDQEEYDYNGCVISRKSLLRGMRYYDMAVRVFLHQMLEWDMQQRCLDTGVDEWLDLSGLPAPRKEVERLLADVKSRVVDTIDDVLLTLDRILDDYHGHAAGYAQSFIQKEEGDMFFDMEKWQHEAETAYNQWVSLIRKDAEKEFALGDVSEHAFRQLLEEIK